MSGFSFGLKKTKNIFKRQKELEEEKKKRDDEEAAKVYEEFVEAFAGEEKKDGPKAFVRGGTIQPGSSAPVRKQGGKGYVPSFMPPGMAAAMAGGGGAQEKPEHKEESVFQPPPANRGKVRSIDLLLQNMKKEQEQRASRREQGLPPVEEQPGSFDTGDPTTTNLYIGNLAPDVDEHVLMREFGRFGPIASVKIMWPRDEEQRRRARNNGFVAFMRREDADRAKDALDGVLLHDLALTIGWGKAVSLPRVPCWPPPGGLAAAREGGAAVPPPSVEPHHHGARRGHSYEEEGPPAIGRRGGGSGGHMARMVQGLGPDIEVEIPSDHRQRFVIDALAFYVMRDGTEFEQVIMEREASNPEFNFLYDVRCPEHAYYRWRLFSLANGDSLRSWRVEPFLMVEESNRWIPPPMTLGAPDHKTAAQRGDRREDRPLSDLQRDKFEDMLRKLSVERADICAAMAFAMDNAESATEVVEVLSDALTLAETPIPLKVARLFLVSDILHNSTAPVRNASRYRSRLEEHLPDVFESLQESYRTCESRMGQELLRRHVLKVLRVWRGWYIFGDDFLNGLQATFLRGSAAEAGSGGNTELEAELEALPSEELETRCRRAGVSRKGGKGAQISRLLSLDAYLNGEKQPPTPLAASAAAGAGAGAAAGGGPLGRPGSGGGGGAERDGSASGWADVTDVPPQPARALSKWEREEAEEGAAAQANDLQEGSAPAQPPQPPPLSGPLANSRWAAAGEDEGQEGAAAELGSGRAGGTPTQLWRPTSGEDSRGGAAAGSDSDGGEDIFAGFGGGGGGAESAAPAATPKAAGDAAGGGGAAAAATPRGQVEAGGVGGAEKLDAAEEERRQRLRQVEVSVMLLREELEEKGVGREELERQVAELRAKLVAEAEAAAHPASKEHKEKGGSKDKERGSKSHKDKDRDRERGRDRDRDKDRERDKERERERKRSRSPHRSRHSSRSRSPPRRKDRSHSRSKSPPKRSRGSRSPAKRSRSGADKEERHKEERRRRDRSRSRSRSRDRKRR